MYYCDSTVSFSPDIDQIFSPILHRHTIFAKKRTILVRSGYKDHYCRLQVQTMAIPVLLPQTASMISLDAVGDSIKMNFYEHVAHSLEDSGHPIFTGRLRNFEAETNRAVSMGNYTRCHLSPVYLQILRKTIEFEMMISSSLIHYENGVNFLHSPLRWLQIPRRDCMDDGFIFYFNSALIYISHDDIERIETRNLNQEFGINTGDNPALLRIPCKWVGFAISGRIFTKPIIVYAHSYHGIYEDLLAEIGDKGCYFRATILTYTRYNENKTINVLDQLHPIDPAPYEMLPYFMYFYVDPAQLQEPLIQYSVPVNAIDHCIERMNRFQPQHPSLTNSLETYLRNKYPLFRYSASPDGDFYNVSVVHPVFIYRLIQFALKKDDEQAGKAEKMRSRYAVEILEDYQSIAEILSRKTLPLNMKAILPGFGILKKDWVENFTKYLNTRGETQYLTELVHRHQEVS